MSRSISESCCCDACACLCHSARSCVRPKLVRAHRRDTDAPWLEGNFCFNHATVGLCASCAPPCMLFVRRTIFLSSARRVWRRAPSAPSSSESVWPDKNVISNGSVQLTFKHARVLHSIKTIVSRQGLLRRTRGVPCGSPRLTEHGAGLRASAEQSARKAQSVERASLALPGAGGSGALTPRVAGQRTSPSPGEFVRAQPLLRPGVPNGMRVLASAALSGQNAQVRGATFFKIIMRFLTLWLRSRKSGLPLTVMLLLVSLNPLHVLAFTDCHSTHNCRFLLLAKENVFWRLFQPRLI